jgi:transcriptional regulator with XRE-family HTH domain
MSASVIQNIEAGRKPDISVSDLLNLAFALRIPPTFLLFPMAGPMRPVDLVGLSPDLEALQSGALEAWIAAEVLPYGVTFSEAADLDRLKAQREYLRLSKEVRRLWRSRIVERRLDEEDPPSPEALESRRRWDTTEARLKAHQERLDELRTQLQDDGWATEETGGSADGDG